MWLIKGNAMKINACIHHWVILSACYVLLMVLTSCGGGGGGGDNENKTTLTTPAPQNVSAVAADSQVIISWNSVDGATAYNIYWNTTGNVTKGDKQIAAATSPYTHAGLTNGVTYYYTVTAIGSEGESALSSEVNVTPSLN